MTFQREQQRLAATEILQQIANGEEIRLNRCTISGQLDINRLFVPDERFETEACKVLLSGTKTILTLSRPLHFNGCVFEEDVVFAPPWEAQGKLQVVFESDVLFNSSEFKGQARFTNGIFKGIGSFDGCLFNRVCCFRNTDFAGIAMFRTVNFEGYGLFTGAVFNAEARFTNTGFGKGGNFTSVRFNDRTDFSGVYSRSKSVPIYESVKFTRKTYGDDETFWRFIKQAAREAGHYQLAGESFYNERCAHLWRKLRGVGYERLSGPRKVLRLLGGVKLLPELIFGRMLFGYGEKPQRVLIAGLVIILSAALFYCSPQAQLVYRGSPAQDVSYFDAVYFSVVTFTAVGYGDMYPADHVLTRAIAITEASVGLCLIALFIVGLSKKFSSA